MNSSISTIQQRPRIPFLNDNNGLAEVRRYDIGMNVFQGEKTSLRTLVEQHKDVPDEAPPTGVTMAEKVIR